MTTESTSTANGADKSAANGVLLAAANGADKSSERAATPTTVIPAAPAPASRPLPSPRSYERTERSAEFDGFSRLTATSETGSDAKLAATTRMVNAFTGYLQNACGRKLDEMTPSDVATLGSLLGAMNRLETTTKRGGH